MLFNSFEFIFLFLPLAILGYSLAQKLGHNSAICWLVAMSLFFYGWWNPPYLILLLGSIFFNYACARIILVNESNAQRQMLTLAVAILINLGVLFYYKYFFWFLGFALNYQSDNILLPLGISFFTFTQIGYLVDCREGGIAKTSLISYMLFVTFFPHLIAGPILHHREMIPQFDSRDSLRSFQSDNFAAGLTMFLIGLAKKAILADGIATWVGGGFAEPDSLGFFAAWGTALSYAFQLYFDFSGYTDMAIGVALIFGIRFPLNFNSPYKATGVIEFWQRWHMTLTNYLTLYLYSPLALRVSRYRASKGMAINPDARRTISGFFSMVILPTMYTMILAGVWHGAGLQYLVFGALHGFYLVVNHFWRIWKKFEVNAQRHFQEKLCKGFSILITFLAVVVAFVFFRSSSVSAAISMLAGMAGLHGIEPGLVVTQQLINSLGVAGELFVKHNFAQVVETNDRLKQIAFLIFLGLIIWGMPNSQQIMYRYKVALNKVEPWRLKTLEWQLNFCWMLAVGVMGAFALLIMSGNSEFLYFQF